MVTKPLLAMIFVSKSRSGFVCVLDDFTGGVKRVKFLANIALFCIMGILEELRKMEDKCKKKLTFKERMDCLDGSKLFFFTVVIIALFVLAPLLLKINFFNNVASWFLKALKFEGYKSSYLETVGALLGTFFAITGALWTQRKEERRKEKQVLREVATVIYYDFEFAYKNIIAFVLGYEKDKEKEITQIKNNSKMSVNEKNEKICKIRNNEKLLDPQTYFHLDIDSDWIKNVSKLRPVLTNSEVEQIYRMYGDLQLCKNHFANNNQLIEKNGFSAFYNFLTKEICFVKHGKDIVVLEKIENIRIRCKLKKLMNGVCRSVR